MGHGNGIFVTEFKCYVMLIIEVGCTIQTFKFQNII